MLKLNTTPLGISFRSGNFSGIFGNHLLIRSTYKSVFSKLEEKQLTFSYSNQVHGNGIQFIEAGNEQPDEADALLTSLENQALVIKTADCIPVVLINHTTQKMCLIHAGWRGVLNDICIKALHLIRLDPKDKIEVFMGPHIRQKNFQVGLDLIELFQAKFAFVTSPSYFTPDSAKQDHFFFDLTKLLKNRLSSELVSNYELHDCGVDTFESSNYHSHRRNHEQAGRNLSIAYRSVSN